VERTLPPLQLTPNPASDKAVLTGLSGDLTEIAVFDLGGRCIQRLRPTPGVQRIELDVRSLPNGVHAIVVSSPSGNRIGKLVVTH
jgi:hypothetical protein